MATIGITTPPFMLGELWHVTIAQIAPVLPYLLMVLLLIFRPTGLLGRRL
jgi:branched-chain amino acid transport system permease protein